MNKDFLSTCSLSGITQGSLRRMTIWDSHSTPIWAKLGEPLNNIIMSTFFFINYFSEPLFNVYLETHVLSAPQNCPTVTG